MHSAWQNPLPLGKYTSTPVTVYFRSGSKWIPVFKTTLKEALVIHRRGTETKTEFFIFPNLASPVDLGEKTQPKPIELFPQDAPIIPVEAEDCLAITAAEILGAISDNSDEPCNPSDRYSPSPVTNPESLHYRDF